MTGQRKIGMGVIGCGYWGAKIIRNLAEMLDVDLITVSDLSEKQLHALIQHYPDLHITTDYQQLLRDPAIDAVAIVTPIRTHYRLAMDALRQGKHVFVEKPLATSTAECQRLIDTAETAGRVLMVGHTYQYNPAIEQLRHVIRSRELGKIFYIDSARLNLGLFQRDIDVMWDLAPHDISILIHILGSRPERVSAHGEAHVLDGIDDVVHVHLYFSDGVDAHIRLSWLDPFKVRRVTVVGSKKMAIFNDLAEDKLRVYARRVELRVTEEASESAVDYFEGDEVGIPYLQPREPLRVELAHFVESIQRGQRPTSDGYVGMEVVRILEALDASRRRGGHWVPLEWPAAVQQSALASPRR